MTTSAPQRLASREEWLRARRIGSSDVSAILGVSRYSGPWDVFERLVLGVHHEARSDVQARGIRLEPRVLAMYAAETGQRVVRTPPHTLYAREDWATATPDARTADRIVEAKTDRDPWNWGPSYTHIRRWEPGAERVVRVDYWLQLQHQLWVCDVPAGDLAVLVPGQDPLEPELRVYHIDRDDAAVERIAARCRAWWQRHIVEGVEPEIDGSDAAGRALARIERAGQREATTEEARLAAYYATSAELEKTAREQKKAAGRLLVAKAGGTRRLELPDGGHVTVVSSVGTSELDEGSLLAARPDLAAVLDEHRRPRNPYAFPRVVPGKRRDDVVSR